MNKKKIGLLSVLLLLICLMLPTTALAAQRKDGWYQKGTAKWYYSQEGKNRTGWMNYKGKKYYLQKDKNGRMAMGWYKAGAKWYYFEPSKQPIGAMKKGWLTLNGKKYYLSKTNGVMYTGKKKIGVNTYVFAPTGELLKTIKPPSWKTNDKGKWYDNGDGTFPKNTWKTISGKTYYFNKKGYVLTGWQKLDTKTYYFGTDGAMAKKKWISTNGKKYYVDSNGVMPVSKWVGKRYVGVDGYWIKNYQSKPNKTNGWVGDNSTVRLHKNNSAAANWRYYQNGVALKGWQMIYNKYYYFESDGYMRIGWLEKGGSRYFLNTTSSKIIGSMVTGWIRIDGALHYFFPTGKMARSQTLLASDKRYYTFDSDGRCVKVSQ